MEQWSYIVNIYFPINDIYLSITLKQTIFINQILFLIKKEIQHASFNQIINIL